MPLIAAALEGDILQLQQNPPPDPATAANLLALAFQKYALQGLAGGFPLIAPGPGVAAMATPLVAAYTAQPGVPPVVAQAIGAMVASFWSGALFAFAPAPGIAAPPVALPALIGVVSGALAAPNPAEVYAKILANAIDACSRSVIVTFIPPPPAVPFPAPVT